LVWLPFCWFFSFLKFLSAPRRRLWDLFEAPWRFACYFLAAFAGVLQSVFSAAGRVNA